MLLAQRTTTCANRAKSVNVKGKQWLTVTALFVTVLSALTAVRHSPEQRTANGAQQQQACITTQSHGISCNGHEINLLIRVHQHDFTILFVSHRTI